MDIRSWRAGRDRRYGRLWWAVFLSGCCLAVAIVATIEEFNVLPWLIVGALVGMILRRRRHHREQALSDARVDAQAKQVAEARTAVAVELAKSVQRLAETNNELAKLVAETAEAQKAQGGSAGDDPPKG